MQISPRSMDQSLSESIELFCKTHEIKSTFNENFTAEIQEKFLKNGLINVIMGGSWPKLFVICTEYDFTKIFPYMRKAQCRELCLNYKYFPDIIQRIYEPDFSKLKTLHLQGNHIMNIEGLTFITMENVKALYLTQNWIVNFKSLSKTRWNKLKTLKIDNNPVSEIILYPFKVNSIFSVLFLEQNFATKTKLNDIRMLMKFQATTIDAIKLSGVNRINQPKTYQLLSKKYLEEIDEIILLD